MRRVGYCIGCLLSLILTAQGGGAQSGANVPAQSPIRVSGGVMAGTILTMVMPVIPKEVWDQPPRLTAVLAVIIGTDGRVESAEAIYGDPRIVAADIDAVKQWRYRTYLVDGLPQRVATTVTINF